MIGSLYSGISGLKANSQRHGPVIGDNIGQCEHNRLQSIQCLIFQRIQCLSGAEQNANRPWRHHERNERQLEFRYVGDFRKCHRSGDQWPGHVYCPGPPAAAASIIRVPVNLSSMWTVIWSTRTACGSRAYSIDPSTGTVGSLGDITMPAGMSEPLATSAVTIGMNLDAGAAVADTYDTTVTTYDSLGNPVELNLTFSKTVASPATWTYAISPSITGATAAPAAGSGTLTFDGNGDFSGTTPQTITVTGLTPAADMSITWADLDTDVTGYAADSVKTAQTQNGYPSGMLQGISVDEEGVFTGLYSNGTMLSFAQVALADFASYSGLAKQGSNLFYFITGLGTSRLYRRPIRPVSEALHPAALKCPMSIFPRNLLN